MSKRYEKYLWLFPFVLAWIVYLPALNNGLVFDDINIFKVQLPSLRYLSEAWFYPVPFSDKFFSYRPMHHSYLMLMRNLIGNDPWGYHLVLLILNGLNALLVYGISLHLFKGKPGATLGALAASTLFAVHPIHVEVVAWIAATPEALLTLFFLLAFYFYILFRENPQKKIWLILSAISFLLSLFTKETAVSFLVIVPLYDILIVKPSGQKPFNWKTIYLVYVTVFLLFLGMRYVNLTHHTFPSLLIAPGEGVIKLILSIGYYLQKILWPHVVNPYATALPSSTGFVLGSIVLLSIIFIICIYKLKSDRLLVFTILFFIVTLLPGAYVAVGSVSKFLLAERYLYLPSYGFCVLFGLLMMPIKKPTLPGKIQSAKIVFWIGILLISGIVSHERVKIWRDELTFWQHNAVVNPLENFPVVMVGKLYMMQDNCPKAIQYFDKALALKVELSPNPLSTLYVNKATCLYFMGQSDGAAILFEKASQIYPQAKTFYNLGTVYYKMASTIPQEKMQFYTKAKDAFLSAFKLDKNNTEYTYWLAKSYEEIGNFNQAKRYYEVSIQLPAQSEWVEKAKQALKRLK